LSFGDNSTVSFTENSAWYGGAVFVLVICYSQPVCFKITFNGHSNVTLSGNCAKRTGAAISYFNEESYFPTSIPSWPHYCNIQ